MRRLIAILLTLWLPFQATAALAMASCTGHDQQQLVGSASASIDASSRHDMHVVGADRQVSNDPGSGIPGEHAPLVGAVPDGCSQGAQCTLQCVQFLCGDAPSPGLRMAENAPIRYLLKHIALMPPEAIHRPPIALAA